MLFIALRGDEKGMVLVTTLLILSLLLAAGSGVVQSTRTDLQTTANLKRRAKAFYIAQAGLEHAWQELTDGDGLNDFKSVFELNRETVLFRDLPFSAGSYTVTATAVPGSSPNRILVTASGCLPAGNPCPQGHSRSILEGQLAATPLFSHALLAKESITLTGVSTDSFDSRSGPYDPASERGVGHLASNGNIHLAGVRTEIHGDARAGGVVASKDAAVMGVTVNGAPAIKIPTLLSPCASSFSDGSGITGGHYSSTTGDLKTVGSHPVNLAEGIYCLNSIDLSEGGPLTVTGPVIIYLREKAKLDGGGIQNMTFVAANLKIISAHSSGDWGISLAGGERTYLVLYAPHTGVRFVGGGDFFGAVIASRIENKEGPSIHLDRALEEDPGVLARRTAWREIF